MSTKVAARAEVDTALRQEWLDTVAGLQDQIKTWVSYEPGWSTSAGEDHHIEEGALGTYIAADINISTPSGRLVLEPVGRNYPGAGVMELYAWPTLYRVRLVRDGMNGGWRVRTDSGIFLRQEWNRENFITLVNDLLAADA